MVKVTFLGATHEVTGSCTLIEADGKNFLIDCGMEQGPNYYENKELPVKAADIDFVLLTHAHIDHAGNLPLLYAKGFRGNVYTTEATKDLSSIMLRDSANIQEFEAEWRNRKAKRSGKAAFVPAYTMKDAIGVIKSLIGCDYDVKKQLSEGIRVRFTDAGHLLGSASIEIWLREDGEERKIVFSGDLGNTNQPILREPTPISEADYVVVESTYGNRSHEVVADYSEHLAQTIQETFDRGGNLVIPSFAVGRTQEMLYFIRQIKEQGLVTGHGDFPVFVDSPLAVEATSIFKEHYRSCFDEEARALLERGINALGFTGLRLSVTANDSKEINFDKSPKVIISASGMCDAGRIKHHLKHNLWRTDSTILFVGYQAVGTLGRALVEGAKTAKLFGEEINVEAEIKILPGTSGHADDKGLMKWMSAFTSKPARVFVNHGDDEVTEFFAKRLRDELKYDAVAPFSGTVYDLKDNICLREEKGVALRSRDGKASKVVAGPSARLAKAGQRLLDIIKKNSNGTNKDMNQFADEIHALADKWEH